MGLADDAVRGVVMPPPGPPPPIARVQTSPYPAAWELDLTGLWACPPLEQPLTIPESLARWIVERAPWLNAAEVYAARLSRC